MADSVPTPQTSGISNTQDAVSQPTPTTPVPVPPEPIQSQPQVSNQTTNGSGISNSGVSDQATTQLIESLMKQATIGMASGNQSPQTSQPPQTPVPPQPVQSAMPAAPHPPAAGNQIPTLAQNGGKKRSKKGLVIGLILLLLMIAVPVGVYFITQQSANLTQTESQAQTVSKNSDTMTFEPGRMLKFYLKNLMPRNFQQFKITLTNTQTGQAVNIENPEPYIGPFPNNQPWISEWITLPSDGQTQYRISIQICGTVNGVYGCEPDVAWGWIDPEESNGRYYCGNQSLSQYENGLIDITDFIAEANSALNPPRIPMCWADAWIDDPTQDEDFNDFFLTFGYADAPTVTPTVTPSPTSAPQCDSIKIFKTEAADENYVDITEAIHNGTSGVQPGDSIVLATNVVTGSSGARFHFLTDPASLWHTTTTKMTFSNTEYYIWTYVIPEGLTQESRFDIEADIITSSEL